MERREESSDEVTWHVVTTSPIRQSCQECARSRKFLGRERLVLDTVLCEQTAIAGSQCVRPSRLSGVWLSQYRHRYKTGLMPRLANTPQFDAAFRLPVSANVSFDYRPALSKISDGKQDNPRAIRSRFVKETLRSPRSIRPIWLLSIPQRKDSSSWEIPRSFLRQRIAAPSADSSSLFATSAGTVFIAVSCVSRAK